MSFTTVYPINISSPAQITREAYNDVGASAITLGSISRGFLGSTDFEIWDSVTGGTQLTEGVDYTLGGTNTYYTALATPDTVYTTVTIDTIAYQTGSIFMTYKTIGSFTSAEWYNTIQESSSGVFNNAIINGDGAVDQRKPATPFIYTAATTPANSDDTYLLDRWILLSDGNDVVDVSQSTDSPDGSKTSIKSLVATANKKWGFLQIIENENSMPYDNKTVSMGFQVKTTTAKLINNVRCAILSWDSTADTVTSDVVSAWGASGVDPTLVANWTYENTPANIAVTTSWVDDVSTVNVSIDTASMANMAVFIWVDDTDGAGGDELFLSQIRLNEGSIVLPSQPRHYSEELALCQRSYEKSYDVDTYVGAVSTVGAVRLYMDNLPSAANRLIFAPVEYKVSKRAVPSISIYSTAGTAGNVTMIGGDMAATVFYTGENNMSVSATDTSTTTAGSIQFHWTAESEL